MNCRQLSILVIISAVLAVTIGCYGYTKPIARAYRVDHVLLEDMPMSKCDGVTGFFKGPEQGHWCLDMIMIKEDGKGPTYVPKYSTVKVRRIFVIADIKGRYHEAELEITTPDGIVYKDVYVDWREGKNLLREIPGAKAGELLPLCTQEREGQLLGTGTGWISTTAAGYLTATWVGGGESVPESVWITEADRPCPWCNSREDSTNSYGYYSWHSTLETETRWYCRDRLVIRETDIAPTRLMIAAPGCAAAEIVARDDYRKDKVKLVCSERLLQQYPTLESMKRASGCHEDKVCLTPE